MYASASAEGRVRRVLRTATAATHQRLHALPEFLAIAGGRLSLAGYADLIRNIAVFHTTVTRELNLDASRCALLRDDLAELGAAAPERVAWQAPPGDAARLGCTYVVEGSTLGGRVVYAQLDYLFGDSPRGRAFFQGRASDLRRWRATCEQLERRGPGPEALGQMIAGAQDTFRLFERVIARADAGG